jgi:hypothetical protein
MVLHCEGLLPCEFLPPKTTFDSDTVKLQKLCEAIKQKSPGRLITGLRLLNDGA